MSVNKAILVGRLGADPNLRHIPGGKAVCELRVATNEGYARDDGERVKQTEWHRVVVWGEQAQACRSFLSKGREVFIEGRIRNRTWTKDGQKHYATEIVAQSVQFLGGRSAKLGASDAGQDENELMEPSQRELTTAA